MKRLAALLSVLILVLGTAGMVSANNVASSTMHFAGALTPSGSAYIGTIDATAGTYYWPGGPGTHVDGSQTSGYATPDGRNADGGFDLYAQIGAIAYYDDVPQGTINADHDGYPGPAGGGWGDFWSPDVPDWGSYQLTLTATNWYLEFKNAARATPMSGTMDWTTMIATETDVGQYEGTVPLDPDANDGDAALNGGGPGAWDMYWTWGSEVIPLEFPQYKVAVVDLGGGDYDVSLTPYGTRDADSYKIYLAWSQGDPIQGQPGGFFFPT